MRKKILILIMAVTFAAASLLMPATASANFMVCLVHNDHPEIIIDINAAAVHVGHGDTLCDEQPS